MQLVSLLVSCALAASGLVLSTHAAGGPACPLPDDECTTPTLTTCCCDGSTPAAPLAPPVSASAIAAAALQSAPTVAQAWTGDPLPLHVNPRWMTWPPSILSTPADRLTLLSTLLI